MSIKLKDTIYNLINKASKDSSGNIITSTYLKLSGGTLTGILTITDNQYIGSTTSSAFLAVGDNSVFTGATNNLSTIFGSISLPAILRSSANNLTHYRSDKSTNYIILDAFNYTDYAATKDHTHSGYAASSHSHSNYASKANIAFTPANEELTAANVLSHTGGFSIAKGTWNYAGNGYIKAGSFGNIDLAGCSILTFGSSSAFTQLYITASTQSGHSGLTNEMFFYNDHGSDYSPGWTRILTDRNYGSYCSAKSHTHSYLPLSGGTITGTLQIKRDAAAVQYLNASGTIQGWLGFRATDIPTMWKSDGSTKYDLLHTGNWSSYCAASNHNHDSVYVKFSKVAKSTADGTGNNPYIYNIENEVLVSGYYSYWYILNLGKYSGGGFNAQLAMPYQDSLTDSELFIRTANGSTWRDWRRILTSSNYTSYAATKDHTHSQYLTSLPSHTHSYLPLSGGTMTGNITVFIGESGRGLKFGTSTLNSLSNQLLWQSPEAIRFGSTSWDWNAWAGLKYNHSSKIIYLGLADGTIFNANSAQSGGKLYTPGISSIYVGNGSNIVLHSGNWSSYCAAASHAHSYIPLSGGTLSSGTARISRAGSSVMWYQGRANAMMYISSYSGYNAIASMKTTNGDWSIGVYTNNYMYFTYITDANYNSGTNTTTCQFIFRPDGYIQGNLSGYATSAGNADTVDSHHFSTVSALPSSPNANTVYFIV